MTNNTTPETEEAMYGPDTSYDDWAAEQRNERFFENRGYWDAEQDRERRGF